MSKEDDGGRGKTREAEAGANSFRWEEDDGPPESQPRLKKLDQPIDHRTYTMYHGTSREAAASIQRSGFRPSSDGMLGRGVYLSRDLQKASRYPLDLPESQRVVIRVKVDVGKVIAINRQGHPKQMTWRQYGYDTAWVPAECGMVPSGLEEDCVWDPNKITVKKLIYPKKENLSTDQPGDGKTYTMYHGTTREAAASILKSGFRPSSDGMLGRGVYLSRDLQKASRYPLDLPESQRVVIRVKVNVGRVIAINYQGHPLRKKWHDKGYDTAWVPPNCGMVKSGLEEDCVWDPKKITVMNLIHPKSGQHAGASGFYR
ncbi:uncharacterized protein LOC134453472 [Engraulis encrasicolus]|uniref:uncharacterized protein LOC134453472 n=1 Tax=Engraulis encrasicolus TaxID=184585 RepID=UPI002FD6C367